MPGRFEGLSNIKWKLFKDIFSISPENKEVKVCLIFHFNKYNHILLTSQITGCRGCDVTA